MSSLNISLQQKRPHLQPHLRSHSFFFLQNVSKQARTAPAHRNAQVQAFRPWYQLWPVLRFHRRHRQGMSLYARRWAQKADMFFVGGPPHMYCQRRG